MVIILRRISISQIYFICAIHGATFTKWVCPQSGHGIQFLAIGIQWKMVQHLFVPWQFVRVSKEWPSKRLILRHTQTDTGKIFRLGWGPISIFCLGPRGTVRIWQHCIMTLRKRLASSIREGIELEQAATSSYKFLLVGLEFRTEFPEWIMNDYDPPQDG